MMFAELNPMLTLTHPAQYHQLAFNCLTCPGQKIAIHVSIDGMPKGDGVWGLRLSSDYSWNKVSIIPSINNVRPEGHGRKTPCKAHISVTDGKVSLTR